MADMDVKIEYKEPETGEPAAEQKKSTKSKQKKKKRRKKHFFLDVVIVLLLVAGLGVFLSSSFFNLDEIVIKDNTYFTKEQVIELSGAKVGSNLFFGLRTGKIQNNLLEDTYIKGADVKRKLPNKLVITLTERKEFAAINYSKNYYILDEDALILRKIQSQPALTLLEGFTLTNIEPGTPLGVEQNAMLNSTLKLLESAEDAGIFFKKVDVGTVIVRAYVYDTLLCEGTPENFMANMDGLQTILKDLFEKGIKNGTVYLGADDYYSFSPKVDTGGDSSQKAGSGDSEKDSGTDSTEKGAGKPAGTAENGGQTSGSGEQSGIEPSDASEVIDPNYVGD